MNNQQNQARLDHVNLSVRNFEESIEWYRRIFDFQLVEQGSNMGEPWGIVRSGDAMICMNQRPALREVHVDDTVGPEIHRVNHFALRLQDESAFREIVEARRLKTFYDSPIRYPHSTSWYVEDPSGHSIEVVFWKNDTVRFEPS